MQPAFVFLPNSCRKLYKKETEFMKMKKVKRKKVEKVKRNKVKIKADYVSKVRIT